MVWQVAEPVRKFLRRIRCLECLYNIVLGLQFLPALLCLLACVGFGEGWQQVGYQLPQRDTLGHPGTVTDPDPPVEIEKWYQ